MLGFVTAASSAVGEAFAVRLAADEWDLDISAGAVTGCVPSPGS